MQFHNTDYMQAAEEEDGKKSGGDNYWKENIFGRKSKPYGAPIKSGGATAL